MIRLLREAMRRGLKILKEEEKMVSILTTAFKIWQSSYGEQLDHQLTEQLQDGRMEDNSSTIADQI